MDRNKRGSESRGSVYTRADPEEAVEAGEGEEVAQHPTSAK